MFSSDYSIGDFTADILFTVIGTAIVGAALSVFTIPNDIAPGGVSGLATALAAIIPVKVSIWTLGLNLPLLIMAWRSLGSRTLVFTLLSTLLLSLFIDISAILLPAYTNNVLLAAVFGGAISGFGIGLLFIRGISTGGTDLLALLLRKPLPNVPSGTLLLFVDAAVVAAAVMIFRNIEVALYSAITIYVSSKVIDTLTLGIDYAKVVYIITDKGDDIVKALTANTERGTTIFPAVGGYTGQKKQMVMTVTRRNYLAQTLRIIKDTDPASFTFVVDSNEVHGEGFKT